MLVANIKERQILQTEVIVGKFLTTYRQGLAHHPSMSRTP